MKPNKQISTSKDRLSFQKKRYLERQEKEGKTPENNEDVAATIDLFENFRLEKDLREQEESWSKNNLEYDLRSTEWILEKVRNSDVYAQNLYAALCNNDFQKLELIPVLKNETWSCSWRYAGGILADMRQEGDYINWYCSGIRNDRYCQDDEPSSPYPNGFVNEGVVTDEIKEDLLNLGWKVILGETS